MYVLYTLFEPTEERQGDWCVEIFKLFLSWHSGSFSVTDTSSEYYLCHVYIHAFDPNWPNVKINKWEHSFYVQAKSTAGTIVQCKDII